MAKPILKVSDNEAALTKNLCETIEKIAADAIEGNGKFVVGFSGGSLAKYLCSGLPSIHTDWEKWVILFCDERVVSFDDDDSTYKYYRENLLGKEGVKLEDKQILKIKLNVPVSECASDYASQIVRLYGLSTDSLKIPRIDLLLLGMGPDGHTCSLFPSHPALQINDVLVTAISDSPKPPQNRITLTFPVLNNAKYIIFVSSGASKAEMLKKVIDESKVEIGEDTLPSALVRPVEGQLLWYVDKPASSLLT